MTQPPPPPPPSSPPPSEEPTGAGAPTAGPSASPVPAGAPPYPAVPAPVATSMDRLRYAYQRRNESDYIFDFWSALGWTILTCGVYSLYVLYQLMRRMRDHKLRRLEVLESANALAWEQATARGMAEQLTPNFERVAQHLNVLRAMTGDFRDPTIWVVIAIFASTIATIVAFILLDQDLVKLDYHEGGAANELSAIYAALGTPVPAPDPTQLKQPHNYVGRVVATVFSCGFYSLWWEYNVMVEGNRHFEADWAWEDALAGVAQQLAA